MPGEIMPTPSLARERDLFFHALLTLHWGTGLERQIGPRSSPAWVAHQLGRLYQHPAAALAAIRADRVSHDAAARTLASLQEVGATRNRPLLLEVLFIGENIITGPQHFEHAFEVEERLGVNGSRLPLLLSFCVLLAQVGADGVRSPTWEVYEECHESQSDARRPGQPAGGTPSEARPEPWW